MSSGTVSPNTILCFRPSRSVSAPRLDQRSLMEAVYAAGSLPVAAGDWPTKSLATRLTIYGLVVIDEVQADGSTRRLRASEAAATAMERAWRVSKPSFRHSVGSLPSEPAPVPSLVPFQVRAG
jgi:hypothetical protein